MNADEPIDPHHADTTWQCLAALAVVDPDATQIAAMHACASHVHDWQDFAARAETHGIAPLASQHIRDHDIAVDGASRRALNALVLRHREADRILNLAAIDLVRDCESAKLQALVLKGTALAHMIYPQSGLRPRRDIDLLAGSGQASDIQGRLAGLGYSVPATHAARAMRFHHHLPVASREVDGMTVSVEIHSDALSGDYPENLNTTTLSDHPQALQINDTPAWAFGHRDMLHHLCLHALEPGEPMRLMAMADIVGYAQKYHQQIDWYALRRSHPRVFNALTHLHYVRPHAQSLSALHPDSTVERPEGIGQNMATMKQILNQPIPHKAKLRQLLFPSPWWMRAYYGAPPDAPLGRLRFFRHLPRIARWAARRLIAQGVSR